MFDWFSSTLCCPSCGKCCSGTSGNLQTKIAKAPYGFAYSVGSDIDADWSDICNAGYLQIQAPRKIDCVSLLETWSCPHCEKPFLLARVEILHGKVAEIVAAELTEKTIRSANYISDECQYLLDSPCECNMILECLLGQLSKR